MPVSTLCHPTRLLVLIASAMADMEKGMACAGATEPTRRTALQRPFATAAAIALVFFALAGSPAVATPLVPGTIVVVDVAAFGGNGGVIGVDPLTGAQTVVSSGGNFEFPLALEIGRASCRERV